MKKLLMLPVLFLPALTCAYESAASKYYSGKISTEEYVDSLCPQKYEPPVTVKHSDGSWSRIQDHGNGTATVKHSNPLGVSTLDSPKISLLLLGW
jgi:hypothetical protein